MSAWQAMHPHRLAAPNRHRARGEGGRGRAWDAACVPANRTPSVMTRVGVSAALLVLMTALAALLGQLAGGWGWALLMATPLGVATALLLLHGVWRPPPSN